MTSPFSAPDAQIFLGGLLKSDDPAIVIKRAIQAYDAAMDTAIEKHSYVPERLSIECWVSCCLVDAVVNGTEYEADDTIYQKSFKAVQSAFTKRKLFHRETIHDIRKTRQAAFDVMLMFDDEEHSELARRLHGTMAYAAFSEAVTDLLDRLEPPLKRG